MVLHELVKRWKPVFPEKKRLKSGDIYYDLICRNMYIKTSVEINTRILL